MLGRVTPISQPAAASQALTKQRSGQALSGMNPSGNGVHQDHVGLGLSLSLSLSLSPPSLPLSIFSLSNVASARAMMAKPWRVFLLPRIAGTKKT